MSDIVIKKRNVKKTRDKSPERIEKKIPIVSRKKAPRKAKGAQVQKISNQLKKESIRLIANRVPDCSVVVVKKFEKSARKFYSKNTSAYIDFFREVYIALNSVKNEPLCQLFKQGDLDFDAWQNLNAEVCFVLLLIDSKKYQKQFKNFAKMPYRNL